jgi:hypothetical protein
MVEAVVGWAAETRTSQYLHHNRGSQLLMSDFPCAGLIHLPGRKKENNLINIQSKLKTLSIIMKYQNATGRRILLTLMNAEMLLSYWIQSVLKITQLNITR